MVTVVKLGGAVLTEKDQHETVAQGRLDAAAEAIADHGSALVVVHGGGSFGHPHAEAHGVTTAVGSHDASSARAIHDAMHRLNEAVLDALHARTVPALPVHPLSVAHRGADGTLTVPTEPLATLLAEGFVPVLHGDVIAHSGEGVTVVSGDELVVALGEGLGAARVGVCSSVPGVLDVDGTLIDRITRFEDVAEAVGESEATDVTGGMAGKVTALLGLSAPASIFGLDDLSTFLDGEQPGTLVE